MKLKILTYNYNTFEPDLFNYNFTEENGEINVYFDLKQDNLMLIANVVIEFQDRDNEFEIKFMNRTIDFCKMLHNRHYSPLAGSMYAALRERSPVLPNKCPIKKVCLFMGNQISSSIGCKIVFLRLSLLQKLYSVSFANFETDKIPPIWPENKIRFTMKKYLYVNNTIKLAVDLSTILKLERK